MRGAAPSGQSRELVRLCTIPRGNQGEEMRVSVDEYTPDGGKPSQYVSERVWYPNSEGEMRPGKSGTTVRRGELAQIIAALQRAERILTGKDTVTKTDPRQQQLQARGQQQDDTGELF